MGNRCKDLEDIPWLCFGKWGVCDVVAPGDVVPQLSWAPWNQGIRACVVWEEGGEESRATAGVKPHLLWQRDWKQPGQSLDNSAALSNSSCKERLLLISGVRKCINDARSLDSIKQKPWNATDAREIGTNVFAPPSTLDESLFMWGTTADFPPFSLD